MQKKFWDHLKFPVPKYSPARGGIPCKGDVYFCSSLATPLSHVVVMMGKALAVHVQLDRRNDGIIKYELH